VLVDWPGHSGPQHKGPKAREERLSTVPDERRMYENCLRSGSNWWRWSSNIDNCDPAISPGFKIAYRLLAEESTGLPAKLAHTLVANLVRSACGIETVHQHSLTSGLEPQLV
jgi:hypothetical protein